MYHFDKGAVKIICIRPVGAQGAPKWQNAVLGVPAQGAKPFRTLERDTAGVANGLRGAVLVYKNAAPHAGIAHASSLKPNDQHL